jgi:hypothetical protein
MLSSFIVLVLVLVVDLWGWRYQQVGSIDYGFFRSLNRSYRCSREIEGEDENEDDKRERESSAICRVFH